MDMKVNIAGVEWKNPVTVASGTFGSGEEFSEFVDLNRLGAVTTKGVANVPWPGNPTPRVAEVYGGMMNAIGLQNPGIDLFCKRDIPFLKKYDTKIIVNVCGHAPEEYLAVVERLADEPIDMMEINISCPNVNAGFLAFGQDAKHVEELTAQIKKIAKQPIIMKLTPNVTDITEIAKAAEAGGADALSVINTLTGMKIDINRRTFAVANKTGGVSGPVVHPIAVRMVYQTAQAVNIPIINRSVVWWNSLHQGPSITARGSSIDGAILWPLWLTLIGFSLLFGAIVLMRMRTTIANIRVEARMRRMALESDSGEGA